MRVVGRAIVATSLWFAQAGVVACGSEADEPRELLVTRDETPGTNCELGGVAIDAGVDADGDGALSADEVTSTRFVCTPLPPPALATLVATTYEAPGEHCEFGGSRVDSGQDTDGDRTLDADEMGEPAYVCSPEPPLSHVHIGNYVLDSAASLAALDGIEIVLGDLVIAGATGAEDVELPDLELVTGTLRTSGCETDLVNLSLPALTGLTAIDFSDYCQLIPLESVSAPLLTKLGSITVWFTQNLHSFSLPAIEEIGSVTMRLSTVPSCTFFELYAFAKSGSWESSTTQPLCDDPAAVQAGFQELPNIAAPGTWRTAPVKVPYDQALSYCRALGGTFDLMVFNSDQDWVDFRASLPNDSPLLNGAWIGLSDAEVANDWRWVTGDSAYQPDPDPSTPDAFWRDGFPRVSTTTNYAALVNGYDDVVDLPASYSFQPVCRAQ